MSGRVRPRQLPIGDGYTNILHAIEQASKTPTGFRCPKCGVATTTVEDFHKHIAGHVETWQQDLARCFDRGMDRD